MVPKATIEQVLADIAGFRRLSSSQVTLDSEFIADLAMDSVDMLDLAMQLEEQLQVSIPNSALENIKTVGQLVTFLQDKNRIKE